MKSRLFLCVVLLSLLAGSFPLHAAAPIAVTVGTSNVSSNAATLHGLVTPRAANTRAHFQWGLTTNYGNLTATQILSGSVAVPVQRTLNGLLPKTTYHFRMVARNAYGVRYGTNFSFTSAGFPPLATTLNPTDITGNSATLRGFVDPNNLAAEAFFEWGLTTNYGNTTATQALAASGAVTPIQQNIGGLFPGTSYHYRMVARNADGVHHSTNVTFTTVTAGLPPLATTENATALTAVSAMLNGTVNPNGQPASVSFEWGSTTNYGNTTPAPPLAAGTTPVAVQSTVNGLTAGATYHFRVIAINSGGASFGSDAVFTTPLTSLPFVATINPTSITTNAARVNGTVNPGGLATTAYFEWGPTTNYGMTTPAQTLGAGSADVPVNANLSNLVTDTPYHYRIVASNALGIAHGDDVIVTPTLLLYLYTGESWTYMFHDLPYTGLSFNNPGGTFLLGQSILGFLPGTFAPGSQLRFDLLFDSPNEGGVSTTVTPGSFPRISWLTSPLWPDLQGGVRLTMLTGSVVVSSVTFEQMGPRPPGSSSYQRYANAITPTKFLQPPAFGTQFVSSVSSSSAVVNFDTDVKNLDTGVFVEWGSTTNYGAAVGTLSLNFDYSVRRSITVSNLVPGTPYRFRVVATNSAGTTYGHDLPFISGIVAPRIMSISWQPSESVWLQATGTAAVNYTLEYSATLSNWIAVTNLTFGPTGIINTTQDASGVGARFFRFRWP